MARGKREFLNVNGNAREIDGQMFTARAAVSIL